MPLRALFALLLLAAPATASEEVLRFDVSLRGVVAAQVAISGRQDGDAYSVSVRMESTGMVRRVAPFGFAAEARGQIRDNRPLPTAASLSGEGQREARAVTLRYPGGVPQVEIVPPPAPQPWDLDPAAQVGRADPASLFWAALRSRPAAEICDAALPAFDGRRAGDLILAPPVAREDGTATCNAEWRRVAGYDPEEMAERSSFPFVLTWAPDGAEMRLVEIRAPTRWGDAVLRRR